MKMLPLFFLLLITPLLSEEPNAWLGKKVPQLILENGKTYTEVTFTKIEPDAVTVTHAGGIMRIPMESLKVEAREALRFDPEKAAEARKAQASARAEAEAKQLAKVALTTEAKQLIAEAREIKFEVWNVHKEGVEAYGVTYLEKGNLVEEKGVQFIAMQTNQFELYEGQMVTMIAVPSGTVKVEGDQLKLWQHLPTN